jgi:phosphatidylglycerophosphate synthase
MLSPWPHHSARLHTLPRVLNLISHNSRSLSSLSTLNYLYASRTFTRQPCPPRRAFSFDWTSTRIQGGLKGTITAKRAVSSDSRDRKPESLSSSTSSSSPLPTDAQNTQTVSSPKLKELRENIYTLPNLLTVSRILACPVLGWSILDGNFHLATGLLAYAGVSDWVDGFLARRYKMQSVLGTILDPAADKTLMTTLVVTTCMKGLLPLPLLVIILGRDVLLSLSAFWIRYTSLPEPVRSYPLFSSPKIL